MSKIYTELAQVYDEMYHTIFDYKEHYERYKMILDDLKSSTILEIGCGSGNLAEYFLKNERFEYLGVDLSKEMIQISHKRHDKHKSKFLVGDMRKLEEVFKEGEKFDCVLITGRSFTHLSTNKDVMDTFKSVFYVLKKNGFLIFDNFDADHIFSNFRGKFEQKATFGKKKYTRKSKTSVNFGTGFTWNWNATYEIEEEGKEKRVIEDYVLLRAFLREEIKLMLKLNKFLVKEFVKLEDKAFLTIAKKGVVDEKNVEKVEK